MHKETNQQRINNIYQMLLEMAEGNFSYRIPRTDDDDELEALIVLLNWLAEEMKESIFHSAYINPHFTYRYVVQSTYILNLDFLVKDFSTDVPFLLGMESNKILGRKFTDILEKESQTIWSSIIFKLLQSESYYTTLPLKFITSEELLVPGFCSISRLWNESEIIISSFNAIVEQTVENIEVKHTTINQQKEEINSHLDIKLIQSVYDFILMHKSTSFPTLKELARIFGTNEYKLKVGFRYLFKTSIYQFYNNERLKRSLLLIKHTKIPLKNIALMVGFSTYPNFSRAFKIKFGHSPTEITRKAKVD